MKRDLTERVESGVLHRLKIVTVEELESMAEYVEQFGEGESAWFAANWCCQGTHESVMVRAVIKT
jgi:hypothetical protein